MDTVGPINGNNGHNRHNRHNVPPMETMDKIGTMDTKDMDGLFQILLNVHWTSIVSIVFIVNG